MNKIMFSALAAVLLTALCFAQTNTAQQPVATAPTTPEQQTIQRFAPGTLLRVELDKTLDAKKLKSGDPIEAKTMDDIMSRKTVVAPKGLRVVGHVVTASTHQGETPSTLGIAFDKLIWKDGTAIPLNATVEAIGKRESYAAPATDESSPGGGYPQSGQPSMGGSRGGMTPGGTPGGANRPDENGGTAPSNAPSAPTGQLSANAHGVVGISGLTLSTGSDNQSVVTSEKHNVKLDSGTQMVIRTS